ncbi:hypothetical protein BDV93DRAFT_570469 [Ceratobasidium sp. AG-I]|nr:hypothetical protein BDV93DRAFT_570469 [Ceratobasidium sp. AG-I]
MTFIRRASCYPSLRLIFIAHTIKSMICTLGLTVLTWNDICGPDAPAGSAPADSGGLWRWIPIAVYAAWLIMSFNGMKDISWANLFLWVVFCIIYKNPGALFQYCKGMPGYQGDDLDRDCQNLVIKNNIFFGVLTLADFFWCILLLRYVRQVAAQEDLRKDTIALDVEAKGDHTSAAKAVYIPED